MKRFKKGKEIFIFYDSNSQKDLFKALDFVFTKYPDATEALSNKMYISEDITIHMFDKRDEAMFPFRFKQEKNIVLISELSDLEYSYVKYVVSLFKVQWGLNNKESRQRTEDDVDLLYIDYKISNNFDLNTEDAMSLEFLIGTIVEFWKSPSLDSQRSDDEKNLYALMRKLQEAYVTESAVAKSKGRGTGQHPMKDVKALIDGTYDGDTKALMDTLSNPMRDLVNRKIQKKGKKSVRSSKTNIKKKLGIK